MLWTPKPGDRVALMGGADGKSVQRICIIIEIQGTHAHVRSDEDFENETAIEYDFDTPEPMEAWVELKQLRPVIGGDHA